MEQLKCEECGRTVKANTNRCSYCGCPIEVVLDNTDLATPCPKCGKSVGKEMKYCPHCGEKQNINTKSTLSPDINTDKHENPKPKVKPVTSAKQEEKASSDNLEVPMPPKPKIRKGIIIYTLIITVLVIWLVVIGGLALFASVDTACALVFFLSPIILYAIAYRSALNDYRLAQTDYPRYAMRVIANKKRQEAQRAKEKAELEAEYRAAVASQNSREPWAVRYSTSPCPHCGHYKVRHAKWEDKSISVAFWGAASSAIGKNYKCEHCGRMW